MLLKLFQKYLQENFTHLNTKNSKFILAVSGGIDSVVMTDLFYNSGFDFVIAHCNFKLRGEESERDETFVQSLASTYSKEVFIKRFDTKKYAEENKLSIQEAARNLRYDWFNDLIVQQTIINHQLSLATAHNADDNIETTLMFFLRGSGVRGLTGIPPYDKKRKLLRPLLFASRIDIEQYAKENNLNWVEDSSNATEKYTRNFLRNKLIPSVEQLFPDVKHNLLDNIKRFKEVEQLYNYSIQLHKKNLLEFKENEIHIPVLKLKKVKPTDTIIWEIIKDFNFKANQVDEVKKLLNADNSSLISSSTHRIIKNRNWLIIAPLKEEASSHILITENNTEIKFEQGVLIFEKLPSDNHTLQTSNNIAQLNVSDVEYPLLLRKWKQGDYFYPLGMHKKKKLSRFFIDLKLSSTQKENTWLLESNKRIIWVIGQRIDERFRVRKATDYILKITFNKDH